MKKKILWVVVISLLIYFGYNRFYGNETANTNTDSISVVDSAMVASSASVVVTDSTKK